MNEAVTDIAALEESGLSDEVFQLAHPKTFKKTPEEEMMADLDKKRSEEQNAFAKAILDKDLKSFEKQPFLNGFKETKVVRGNKVYKVLGLENGELYTFETNESAAEHWNRIAGEKFDESTALKLINQHYLRVSKRCARMREIENERLNVLVFCASAILRHVCRLSGKKSILSFAYNKLSGKYNSKKMWARRKTAGRRVANLQLRNKEDYQRTVLKRQMAKTKFQKQFAAKQRKEQAEFKRRLKRKGFAV
ncbi:hypothetical protein [Bdellovibrio sp. HCB209]|uniref:hypothetical protein n=1 Tax=Bdellovibrio sp. HCB209 TaxID=3394354 RepID=UPI0039B4357B